MSENNDGKKSLQVVFQRKNEFREDDYDYQYQYASREKNDPKTIQAMKNATKKALRIKLDAMRGDFDRKHCKKKVTISHLVEAIKDSSAKEDMSTDKFVDTVESLMTRFNSDLEKLQKIYTNVMKNLPKIDTK